MSDRLPPLPPDVEALLDGERRAPAAPAGAREQVRARVLATVGLGVTAGAASASAATSAATVAPKAIALGVAGKVVAAACVVTATAGGITYVARRPEPAPVAAPARRERVRAPRPAPIATPPVEKPAVVDAPPAPRPRRERAPAPRPELGDEGALLEQARAAFDQGQPAEAMRSLDEHARRWPAGDLAEERDFLRIRCLVQTDDTAAARARAREFAERYPTSIFRRAVDAVMPREP